MNPLRKKNSLLKSTYYPPLFPSKVQVSCQLMWSACAMVDLLRDKKHSENALSAPVSHTINWTFVREDNCGRLQSLNSFPDGLTPPHKALLSPDMPRKLVAPGKLLRTTAPRAREGALTCQKRNHQ